MHEKQTEFKFLTAENNIEMLLKNLFILRFAVTVILLMHSVPSLFSPSIFEFGVYLNDAGFKPFGVVLAWAIKLSHVAAALCFLLNRFIRIAGYVTLFILLVGIIMVHFQEGWFVIGGGSNGVEFNFLLIAVIITIMFPGSKKTYY